VDLRRDLYVAEARLLGQRAQSCLVAERKDPGGGLGERGL
jgi:hypothetical protein